MMNPAGTGNSSPNQALLSKDQGSAVALRSVHAPSFLKYDSLGRRGAPIRVTRILWYRYS